MPLEREPDFKPDAAKRLSHEFEINSQPGAGTRVSILRWK